MDCNHSDMVDATARHTEEVDRARKERKRSANEANADDEDILLLERSLRTLQRYEVLDDDACIDPAFKEYAEVCADLSRALVKKRMRRSERDRPDGDLAADRAMQWINDKHLLEEERVKGRYDRLMRLYQMVQKIRT